MRERVVSFWERLDKRALAVFLAAAGVRLFWIAVVRAKPVSDFAFYFVRGGELAAGKGYLIAGHPTAYWPPGYPIFLAAFFWLFGSQLAIAKLLNVVMWTASALLMYVLGKRIGGPTAGLVAGLVVALYPEYIFFTGLVASENLFVLLTSIVVVLLAVESRSRRVRLGIAVVAGLLLGWGVLTRPMSVLLPLTLCIVVWLVRRREQGFTTALVIGLCALLAIAPWVIRNRIVMGEWLLTTSGGPSMLIGAHEGATGTYTREPAWMQGTLTVQGELHDNNEGTKAALRFIREHPWEWLSLAPAKISTLFGEPTGIDWNFEYYRPGYTRVFVRPLGRFEAQVIDLAKSYRQIPNFMTWFQSIAWILGALGLLVAIIMGRRAAIWPFAVLAYFLLLQMTISNGQPRFLVSTGPLLAPGIGFLAALVAGRLSVQPALPAEREGEEVAEESAAV